MASEREYQDMSFTSGLQQTDYTLTNAVYNPDGSILLHPNGSLKFTIVPASLTACLYLKQVIDFTADAAFSASYSPKGFATINIKYTGRNDTDNNMIVLNRDVVLTGGKYENKAEVPTLNKQIASIAVTIANNYTSDVTINTINLYKSKDISPFQIADVLKEQVISADVTMATLAISKAMFTQYFRTNVFAMSAQTALMSNMINYMTQQNNYLAMYEANMDATQTEHYIYDIDYPNGTKDSIKLWYTSISGPDAHKYVTTTDPKDKFPSISDIDRNAFRFMVYKSVSYRKMAFMTKGMPDGKGGTVQVPVITLGAGTDKANPSFGVSEWYKDYTGDNHIYTTNTGVKRGWILDDAKADYVGLDNAVAKIRSDSAQPLVPQVGNQFPAYPQDAQFFFLKR